MEVLSVNIGVRRTQPKGDALETTGIHKLPAEGAVEIGHLGIKADFIADLDNHGGPDQAIYVYGAEDYAWWSVALGRSLAPGTFGENLTISGLQSAQFSIGDRLRIGSAVLEVSSPRIPCATLARRMGDPHFVKKYRRAERPGLYCRVLKEGAVRSGDVVHAQSQGGDAVPLLHLFRQHYVPQKDEARLQWILRAPLAARARRDIERDLAHLRSAGS